MHQNKLHSFFIKNQENQLESACFDSFTVKKLLRMFLFCSFFRFSLFALLTAYTISKVIAFFVFCFAICFSAAPWLALGHSRGDSGSRLMLIVAFVNFDPKVHESFLTRLVLKAWSSVQWDLNRASSDLISTP